MRKDELERKLNEISQRLSVLGDLNLLVAQSKSIPEVLSSIQNSKTQIESFLTEVLAKKEELAGLLSEGQNLADQLSENDSAAAELVNKIGELEKKVVDLVAETKVQLGKAANEKLANSFEITKEEIVKERDKWFGLLKGSIIALFLAVVLVVAWQAIEGKTIFELSFLIRIALTSPIIYFVGLATTEYSRAQNLIEEYTFKASVARSFEAYKEIIESSFKHGDSDVYESKKLEFIIESVQALYTSPMNNIKKNHTREKKGDSDLGKKVEELVFEKVKQIIGL